MRYGYIPVEREGISPGAQEQFILFNLFELWMDLPHGSLRGNGWEAHALRRNEAVAGVGITRGTEIHFCCAPEWRGLLRRSTIRKFLEPLFEARGYLTTRQVLPADPVARRFIDRMGFALTSSDSDFDYFMLSELPFGED